MVGRDRHHDLDAADDDGYADVPPISLRDAATTDRDLVLYDYYQNQDCGFPLANLMTHGIIEGHLQKLGGEGHCYDVTATDSDQWRLEIEPGADGRLRRG